MPPTSPNATPVGNAPRPFEKETWEFDRTLLPELDIFGWLNIYETQVDFLRADRHADLYEIHYVKRGHLRWWVENDSYEFKPGHLLIIRPNELHGGEEDSLHPCEHLWLRVKFDKSKLPGLTPEQTGYFHDRFQQTEHRMFPVSPEVAGYFEKLLQAHRVGDFGHAIIARGVLHALLGTIVRDYAHFAQSATSQPPALVTWRVHKFLDALEKNLAIDILKNAELEAKLGMSGFSFRARFKVETGFSPHDYVIDRCITEARRRLAKTSDEITAIAMDLGFSSSQYFATVFRRRTGLSPTDYRQRQQKSGQSD